MNAKRVDAASRLICESQKRKQTAAGIAADLEAACMLQSPEVAAELATLRAQLTPEREQEIRSRRLDEVTQGPWLVADWTDGQPVVYAEVTTPEGIRALPLLVAVDASEADVQFVASARRSVPELVSEVTRLRAQVAGLLAERHVTNEALSDAAEELRARRDQIAERDAQIVAWLGKKAREYGTSNRESRAKAEAVGRMADKLSRGAVPVRQQEDPHNGPLATRYAIPHDLPTTIETSGSAL